jgi:hypothetical protein
MLMRNALLPICNYVASATRYGCVVIFPAIVSLYAQPDTMGS